MNIGIIGSGMVGQIVGTKLAQLGHAVMIGSRMPNDLDGKKGNGGTMREWIASTEGRGQVGSLSDTAQFGQLIINASDGGGSIAALEQAGAENLRGKVLIDIANPLDFSNGMPPTLSVKDTDSLAEQIQRAFPETHVVKTLNTMNAHVMVDPAQVAGGDHTVFVSGNDESAKAEVTTLLQSFGWRDILDLGDLSTARGTEMLLPLWLRTWFKLGDTPFQFKVAR